MVSRSTRLFVAGLALGAWLVLMTACGQGDAADQASNQHQVAAVATSGGSGGGVCLLPAGTSHLVAMGLESRLLGRASWDPVAPDGLPLVYTNGLDYEALLKVKPEWVIVSSRATGPDEGLLRLAEQAGFSVYDYRYPESIDDAINLLTRGDGDTPGMGEALGIEDEARALAAKIRGQLEAVRVAGEEAAMGQGKPRVLAVFSLDPVIVLGPKTVADELITIAGGINAVAAPGAASVTVAHADSGGGGVGKTVQMDHEHLYATNPDLILILSPGGPPLTADDPRTQAIRNVPIKAVEENRIILIDDQEALLSGARIGVMAEQFFVAFYPEAAP